MAHLTERLCRNDRISTAGQPGPGSLYPQQSGKQFRGVLVFEPISGGGELLTRGQRRKDAFKMWNEAGWVERLAFGVAQSIAQNHLPAGSGARDVTEETLLASLLPCARTKLPAVVFHQQAIRFAQKVRGRGRCRENSFVHAQKVNSLQIRVSRTIHGPDQNLVEHGRNYADAETGKACLQNRKPFSKRESFMRKRNFNVV